METVSIYALCEPGTRTLRYLGASYRVQRRLREHWTESRKRNNYLGHWLSSLSEYPTLIILREVPENEWQDWERCYIRNARMLGFKLVNGTDGGDGISNPSPETRVKMGADKIGKKATAETRAKMSVARSGEKNHNFRKPLSAEQKSKMRLANLGKRHTPEQSIAKSVRQLGAKRADNTSGFVGVCWDASKKKWQARLSTKFIGRFSKIEDAVFVRALVLTSKNYGTFNN